MMKFISENEYNGTKVVVELSDESTLTEAFEEFTNFLRASGYVIDYNKRIDLVNVDE